MTRTETLRRLTAKEAEKLLAGRDYPIEQSAAWARYEKALGHQVWGRYVYEDGQQPVAYVALYTNEIGGRPFLWAKHGPIWFKEQSPEREAHLRSLLIPEVRRRDKNIAFVRMHARFSAPDCHELLNTLTYDRTYIIDLTGRTPEKIAAAMPKDGRRGVKRAERVAKEAGVVIKDETGMDRATFDEVYRVLEETSERDGFTPHSADVYWTMLTTLSEQARMYVARLDGRPVAWVLVVVNGISSVAYYGASTTADRATRAAEATDWYAACDLAAKGYKGYDFMGAGSTRVPELYSVGMYKKRFAQHPTEVDGAWDVPVQRPVFEALVAAKKAKHLVRKATVVASKASEAIKR